MLLFIEIMVLCATGYLYWATRKLAANVRLSAQPPVSQAELHPEMAQVNPIEIMTEVTDLLAEWQAAASTAREDSIRQQANLQETLKQAENAITELSALLNMVEMQPNTGGMAQPGEAPGMASLAWPALETWAEATAAFVSHLYRNGYSQSTLNRTANHLQQFAAWSARQLHQPVRPIEPADLEYYRRHLVAQSSQPDLAEHDMVVIKAFAGWLNEWFDDCQFPVPMEVGQAVSMAKISPVVGKERYRTVFALAEQGLDQALISAQTGLEREGIRLLLAVGPPSPVKP